MRFLTDYEISSEVKQSLDGATKAKLAVAYWGKGAADLLGLSKLRSRAQIVCDAFSGACNPDELSVLIEKHDVKYLSDLHAKVYITDRAIVVGSANASINGLMQEGGEANRHEASVSCADEALRVTGEEWFDRTFAKAQRVDPTIIEKIRPIWKRAQERRPWLTNGTKLLAALRANASDFVGRKINVIVSQDAAPSEAGKTTYDNIKRKHFSRGDIDQYEKSELYPYYEDEGDWRVSPEDFFLDYYDESGDWHCMGLWRVRSYNWQEPREGGGRLIIVDKVDNFDGFRLNEKDGKIIGQAYASLIESTPDLTKLYRKKKYLNRPLSELGPHLI